MRRTRLRTLMVAVFVFALLLAATGVPTTTGQSNKCTLSHGPAPVGLPG